MEKLNIFQIEQKYVELTNAIIENDGVLTDEQAEALQINEAQLEGKGIAYGSVIKKLKAESEIIDAEIKRLTALKKSRTNTAERLKETIKGAMNLYDIDKIESPTLKISLRNSVSTIIEDAEEVPKKFKTVEVTTKINKTEVKKAIESGEEVAGASLSKNQSVQVK